MLFQRISFIACAVLVFAPGARAGQPPCNQLYQLQSTQAPAATAAHDTITHDLFNGRVVSIRPFKENNNQNQLFLTSVEARDPVTGEVRYREAIYKPAIWGDGGGWARTAMEYVAYALNRKLAMDYVPPTVYRRHFPIDINGQHWDYGVLIYKAAEYTPLAKLPHGEFNHGEPNFHDAIESDHRVLSVLLQNGDGHNKNLGQAKHWVDGLVRPVFLDWNASLRRGTNVTLTHYPVFGNSRPVSRVREQTLAALRQLEWADFQPWIADGFIDEGEAKFILQIRDGIVSHFDSLIAERGPDAVLIRF